MFNEKVGDVVTHKSNSSNMVIIETLRDGKRKCEWFDADGNLTNHIFPSSSLTDGKEPSPAIDMSDLHSGDVVAHKSNDSKMVVLEVKARDIVCEWVDAKGHVFQHNFLKESLKPNGKEYKIVLI